MFFFCGTKFNYILLFSDKYKFKKATRWIIGYACTINWIIHYSWIKYLVLSDSVEPYLPTQLALSIERHNYIGKEQKPYIRNTWLGDGWTGDPTNAIITFPPNIPSVVYGKGKLPSNWRGRVLIDHSTLRVGQMTRWGYVNRLACGLIYIWNNKTIRKQTEFGPSGRHK